MQKGLLAGWRAAVLRGCDFVVHHCPCLMEAWLFLSSCCDNAKCRFYERAKGAFPTLSTTPQQTQTHKQPVQCCLMDAHTHTDTLKNKQDPQQYSFFLPVRTGTDSINALSMHFGLSSTLNWNNSL